MPVPADAVHETLGRHILVDGFHIVIDLEKSHGSYMIDAANGRKYLDCYTFFCSLPVGHNHPKMSDPDFLRDLHLAALTNPTNSDIYTSLFAAFVDHFAREAAPHYMKHFFFIAGGALGIENALKAAFDWKVRKNFKRGATRERGSQVIHFKESFHGRTGYTMSLTNTEPVKIEYYPKFKWPRIINPKLSFPIGQRTQQRVENAEKKALTQIKNVIAKKGDDIAALIIEPIQGEGGDNHFRPEFFRELRTVCDESDIMFIVDEVQTGLGMTGKMWAIEHSGVEPDMIVFGKKTQVCGFMANSRIEENEKNVFTVSSRLNSTWGGNLVDMVRCKRYIEIIKEENLVENAAETGAYFLERLRKIARRKRRIRNVRGRGFFIAFDTKTPEDREALRTSCWERGFATLACGKTSVRLRPSLILSKEEVDEACEALLQSL
jgi:L-lysine 6-transaminase